MTRTGFFRFQWRVAIALIALIAPLSAQSRTASHAGRDKLVGEIQQLIATNHPAEAKQLLDSSAANYPGFAGFDNLRGVIAAQQGNIEAARSSFEMAIRHSPHFTEAYLNLGRLYLQNSATIPQAVPLALDTYDKVLRYEPGNQEAQYQVGVLTMRQKKYRESLSHLSRLTSASPDSPQVLSIKIADYAGLGDVAHANEAVSRMVAQSDMAELDVQESLPALAQAKRFDLIVKLLESLQSRHQLSPGMLHSLGIAYEQENKLAQARSSLEQVTEQAGPSVKLLVELARITTTQKDYKGALGYLAHAEDLEPKNAGLYYSFGVICLRMELLAEAQKAFGKAVELSPDNAAFNYAMGLSTSFLHDPNEAVPYFEKYIKLQPKDPAGALAMGTTLYRGKDYSAATVWLTKAVQQPQTATTAHYYLGRIANQQGRTDDAIQELNQALKATPNNADALAELGQSYLLRKDYPDAEAALLRALAIAPDQYTANFNLLTVFTRTKDPRREAQAKRFDEVEKLFAQRKEEYLRVLEIRPLVIDGDASDVPAATVRKDVVRDSTANNE
jgi:tetratricopeptide (TPR) repeat protein